MIKKIILIFLIIGLIGIISASNCKMDIVLSQKTFKSGEDITFRIDLYDSNNNIIYDNVKFTIQDVEQTKKIEKTANSKDIIRINLGEQAKQGQWNIKAEYKDCDATDSFFVEAKKELSFDLKNGILIIKNTGNIPINEKIQIIIGDVAGELKQLNLDVGEEEKYQLIAPEGEYDIKIISDKEVLFSKNKIALSNKGFTGNVIGAINEEASKRNAFTGGIAPTKESDDSILNYMKNSKVAYTFVLVIFGAMILLIIERRYSKKAK